MLRRSFAARFRVLAPAPTHSTISRAVGPAGGCRWQGALRALSLVSVGEVLIEQGKRLLRADSVHGKLKRLFSYRGLRGACRVFFPAVRGVTRRARLASQTRGPGRGAPLEKGFPLASRAPEVFR